MPTTRKLTIIMKDSGSDGWNGNVLAFSRNSVIFKRFGDTFTTGSVSSPFYIEVPKKTNIQIVVLQLGSKTNEVGFVIMTPNGTIVY